MKKLPNMIHNNISLLVLGLLVLMTSSCDTFLDVNSNPNSPISDNLPLSAKLPAALVATVNQESGQINQIGAFWGGYWGTNNDGANQYFDLKTYNGPGIRSQRDGIPVWETGFNNILYFKLIQEESELSGELYHTGVAKIMQGWLFLRLVDFYNNIPFDQAVTGNRYLNPVYEPGETVYQKSLDLISEGIEDVKSSSMLPSYNHGDILFGGEKSKWAKLGNTIKLRALIRQSEQADLSYIQSQINAILAEGSGFLDWGEHAMVNPGYLNSTGKLNPFWASYYRDVQGNATANHQNLRPTTFLIERYQALIDPRLEFIYQDVNGAYNGVIFGNPDTGNPDFARSNTSPLKGPQENAGEPTGLLHAFDQSSVLMTAFESLFLQAEAAQRGWIQAEAAELYKEAIKASMVYSKIPEHRIEAYLDQPDIALSADNGALEQIILQKWLALNSISSIEAWNDYRRLGMPGFPGTAATGITGRPLRLMYPETERGTNMEQVLAQGIDRVTEDKIWWMP
jgi:hypothetical protein